MRPIVGKDAIINRILRVREIVANLENKKKTYQDELEDLDKRLIVELKTIQDIEKERDKLYENQPPKIKLTLPKDFVFDDTTNPLNYLIEKDNIQNLFDCINLLPQRNIKCIMLRFGLNGNKPLTYREIGEQVGRVDFSRGSGPLSVERSRQLLETSLRKLRGIIQRSKTMLGKEVSIIKR